LHFKSWAGSSAYDDSGKAQKGKLSPRALGKYRDHLRGGKRRAQ